MAVNQIDTKVDETGTLVKEIHAQLVGTAAASHSAG